MFDNSRDAFGIALKYLGYSFNTTDKSEIQMAYDLLYRQKPLVQAYVMDQIFDKMAGGEAAVGPYYAGDAITMMDENPDLSFVIPKEGANTFVDAMCIPKGAEHKAEGEAFINFMCSDDATVPNAEFTGYSTPSDTAYKLLDAEIQNSPIIYPSDNILSKCETFRNLPTDMRDLYDSLWIKLKSE
jgi:spermidine/putrescine transport system substrate-binding protein